MTTAGVTRMVRPSDFEIDVMSDAEIDALVASQDTITRLEDEVGLHHIVADYRAYRSRCRLDGVWARFRMTVELVGEYPITAPRMASRPWERREAWRDTRQGFARLDLSAPDVSLLGTSPERVTDRFYD